MAHQIHGWDLLEQLGKADFAQASIQTPYCREITLTSIAS